MNSKNHLHDSREKIINAATEIFSKSGYEATSMEQIAQVVGMRKASLYYYFKDKNELFSAVMNYVWEKIMGDLKEFLTDKEFLKKPPRKILSEIITHVIKVNLRCGLSILKMEQLKGEKFSKNKALCQVQEVRQYLRNFLSANKVDSPEIAEQIIANSVHAYVIHSHFFKNKTSVEKYSYYLASLFV